MKTMLNKQNKSQNNLGSASQPTFKLDIDVGNVTAEGFPSFRAWSNTPIGCHTKKQLGGIRKLFGCYCACAALMEYQSLSQLSGFSLATVLCLLFKRTITASGVVEYVDLRLQIYFHLLSLHAPPPIYQHPASPLLHSSY